MELVTLEATTLPDAWFQALWHILKEGVPEYTVDLGSYAGQIRREFEYITIHIKYPGVKPHIPDMPPGMGIPSPTTQEYVDNYAARYLMSGIMEDNEQYTYGERLMLSMDKVIDRYRKYGHGTNQLIMQVGQPADIDLEDPPCLRHIDTRIRNHKLHFIIYFRSWDLWGGFPANLAGFQQLKEYMAQQIGVEDGEMIVSSKGLHLYGYAKDLAKLRTGLKDYWKQ
jgi:thymidylate synthase